MATRKIVDDFYRKYYKKLRSKSILERADFVFDWCSKNFPYAWNEVGIDGNLKSGCNTAVSDSIGTFKLGKGVCTGRSRLLRMLLNNKYVRVPCYCVSGMCGNLQHEWVEIFDEFNNKFYYDLSFNLKEFNGSLRNRGYSDFEDKLSNIELNNNVDPNRYNSIHNIYLANVLRYDRRLLKYPLGRSAYKFVTGKDYAPPALPSRKAKVLPPPLPSRKAKVLPPPLPLKNSVIYDKSFNPVLRRTLRPLPPPLPSKDK